MKIQFVYRVMFPVLFGLLGGCAVGFDHTLFMTKSNIGVDIDTKPPTAEISIARRELVIAPTFEGGQTPPVLAGFRTANRLLFGFDVSSVFAGGDAAVILPKSGAGNQHDAKLCISKPAEGQPKLGPISFGTYPLPSAGEIHPFVFGTDTSLGLKVAWSGMAAQFPDSFKIGFNRKELALAPVFERENTDVQCPYSVEMPAFLATIEQAEAGASPKSFNSNYRQSFATGEAAIKLAGDEGVKKLLLKRLDLAVESTAFVSDPVSECINDWLKKDKAKTKTQAKIINEWWVKKHHADGSWPLLVNGKKYAEERSQFIKEQQINCVKGE